jgi:hypothetical protein
MVNHSPPTIATNSPPNNNPANRASSSNNNNSSNPANIRRLHKVINNNKCTRRLNKAKV